MTLLAQEFKTLQGALKRQAFENAHSDRYRYRIVRCLKGQPDGGEFNSALIYAGLYTWRLAKEKRS